MRYIEHKVLIQDSEITFRIQGKCFYCSATLPEKLQILTEGYTEDSSGIIARHGTYYLLLKCPYCENLTTELFSVRPDRTNRKIFLEYAAPKKQNRKLNELQLPSAIEKISPKFLEIYSQAYQAEKKNFYELSGMGYRKALEFLVKDYAIYKFPEDKESIIKKSLQNALIKIVFFITSDLTYHQSNQKLHPNLDLKLK